MVDRLPATLNCWDQERNEPSLLDSQEHILVCKKLIISNTITACDKVEYSDIFKEPHRQKEIVALYKILIEERETILKAKSSDPQGENLDPSMGCDLCCSDTRFTSHITCISIGK